MAEVSVKKPLPPWLAQLLRHRVWLLLGLILLFVVAVRVRLRDMPLERDEGEYAYAGQLMLQGVPPYKEAYNMKLPGTYAAYAAIMAVLGQTPAGIHLGVILVNVASILLVFVLGRKLLDDVAGVVAAAVFALMSLSPSVLGLAGHATHFVTFFALAGSVLLVKQTADDADCAEGKRSGSGFFRVFRVIRGSKPGVRVPAFIIHNSYFILFFSGFLFGLAFLMKQHGIFFGIFGVLYLAGNSLLQWREAVEAAKQPAMRKPTFKSEVRGPKTEGSPKSEIRSSSVKTPGAKGEGRGARTEASTAENAKNAESRSQEPGVRSQRAELTPQTSDLKPQPSGVQSSKLEVRSSSPSFVPSTDKVGDKVAGRSSILHPPSSPSAPKSRPSSPYIQEPPPPSPLPFLSALAKDVAVLGAGLALPYALTCLLLWCAGVFPQFWFWTVSYAARYAAGLSLADGAAKLKMSLPALLGPNLGFWLLAVAGAFLMWWEERFKTSNSKRQTSKAGVGSQRAEGKGPRTEDRGQKVGEGMQKEEGRMQSAEGGQTAEHAEHAEGKPGRGPFFRVFRVIRGSSPNVQGSKLEVRRSSSSGTRNSTLNPQPSTPIPHPRLFLSSLFLCSAASVSVGLYFRAHYFITLLPALALLGGVAVSRAVHLLRRDRSIEVLLAVPILLLSVVALGAAFIGQGSLWLALSPKEAMEKTYYTTLFADAAEAGNYIKAHSAKGDRVAVIGSEPEIYFYAHRRSATGCLYMYPLMEHEAEARTMQERVIGEIERARPECAVYVNNQHSWLRDSRSEPRIFQWWNNYQTNFEVVTTIQTTQGPRAFGGDEIPGVSGPDTGSEPESEEMRQLTRNNFLLVLKRIGN